MPPASCRTPVWVRSGPAMVSPAPSASRIVPLFTSLLVPVHWAVAWTASAPWLVRMPVSCSVPPSDQVVSPCTVRFPERVRAAVPLNRTGQPGSTSSVALIVPPVQVTVPPPSTVPVPLRVPAFTVRPVPPPMLRWPLAFRVGGVPVTLVRVSWPGPVREASSRQLCEPFCRTRPPPANWALPWWSRAGPAMVRVTPSASTTAPWLTSVLVPVHCVAAWTVSVPLLTSGPLSWSVPPPRQVLAPRMTIPLPETVLVPVPSSTTGQAGCTSTSPVPTVPLSQ